MAELSSNKPGSDKPAFLLERTLLLLLRARDRETVSGDLLEEYREEKLPALGYVRANLWYVRQVISFAVTQTTEGERMKQLLALTCCFTVVAGVWLAVMENILRHQGYGGRTAIAVLIALQSLATMSIMLLNGRFIFRLLVIVGALASAFLGAAAIFRTAHATHFEGFVLLIGAALLVQGALTVSTLSRGPRTV